MKRQGSRILCALLAAVLCLSLAPWARAASDYDRPNQKLVALTFDDGPGAYSDSILDTLKSHNAKATFFMNGYKVRRYARQVKRMADEGHQIANHTYNHPYLTKCSNAKIQQELRATAEAFTEVTGLTGTGDTGFYLRPPYGAFNSRVVAAAGVPVIWCTVDSGDWKYQNANRLVTYTGSVARDGDIVVMHETHRTTAQGLGRLLDSLQAQGFEMVTLEDLFWRRGITPKPGVTYYSARNTGVNRCKKSLWFDESRLNKHWAGADIAVVRKLGIMTGNSYGEFLPNFPMTRGMFVTALGRLSGLEPEGNPATGFRDVPKSHYAAPYVLWAKENGIMTGLSDRTFGLNQVITRQELAVVLARYAQWRGAEAGDFNWKSYTDSGSIARWAREGVADCSALGLLQGSGGAFLPTSPVTRAMGAAVLARLSRYPFPPEEPAPAETPGETETPAEAETPDETQTPAEAESPAEAETPTETREPAQTEAPAESDPVPETGGDPAEAA